ncbi:MAG: tetratricopeptide repeat protein [Candidatus Didemnitutus sp.]|nr:tetratricopeptide repeat protein [Candidatus Didemnitutus sp.]
MAAFLLGGCMMPGGRAAVDPLTPAEHLQLAVSYEHAGKPDLALREYERAATGATVAHARTGQGNIHLARKDWAAAEASYRSALAVDPDHLSALNNLAWLLATQDRSLEEAERLIRRALALNPEPRAAYEDTLAAILKQK